MKLSELLDESNLGKILSEELEKQKAEALRQKATLIAKVVQYQVEELRRLRGLAKSAKAKLKEMNAAIAKFDETGDTNHLRVFGLRERHLD